MRTHDCWTWQVVYQDGTTLDEIDADGTEHGFAEADLSRVLQVILHPQVEGLPQHVLSISARDAMRPIFVRRRRQLVSVETGELVEQLATIHILGWQKTTKIGRGTRNIAHYSFLFEDGSILHSDDFQAI